MTIPEAATMSRPSPLRLLIVDDQKGLTKVISAAATEFGIETREVNDPTLATQAFIDFRPDVLILDLIMPEKDGVDVLNEVLVIDPAVKVILTSGYGNGYLRLGDAVSRFHRDSAVDVLRKPFRVEALRGLMRTLTGLSSPDRTIPD